MLPPLILQVLILASILATIQAAVTISSPTNRNAVIPGSYIVSYHPNATVSEINTYHSDFLSRFSSQHPGHLFTPLSVGSYRGFHARLENEELLDWVQGSEHLIASIEPDAKVEAHFPFHTEQSDGEKNVTDVNYARKQQDAVEDQVNDNVLALLSYHGRPWNLERISNRKGGSGMYQRLIHPSRPMNLKLRVYVLDSGIRTSHQEFLDIVTGESRAEWGKNFVAGGVNADVDGHGTHVAGTIGGNTYGIENSTTLVSVKVLEQGEGAVSGVISGIQWAYNDALSKNATCIMNLSLGLEGNCDGALVEVGRAARESGCILVASAGNNNKPASRNVPACSGDFVTVGAIEGDDKKAGFSNYGSAVDIFAPGVDIVSASNDDDTGTKTMGGTSMASPHITGLAAYFSALFHLTWGDDIRAKILDVATLGAVDDMGTNSHNRLAYNGNCDSATWGGYFCSLVKEDIAG